MRHQSKFQQQIQLLMQRATKTFTYLYSMCQNKTIIITCTYYWEMTQIITWNTFWLQTRFIKKVKLKELKDN